MPRVQASGSEGQLIREATPSFLRFQLLEQTGDPQKDQ